MDSMSRFVDAQGSPLGVKGRRIAELYLGNDVVIREQFIVAPVTGPIVCLVRLLKAGWEFCKVDDVLHLCRDGHGFPVYFRKNSMYTQGVISKVTEVELNAAIVQNSKVTEVELNAASVQNSISAIRLTALDDLKFGWNKLTDDVWAMESYGANFIDTTTCTAPFLLWLRTTLVEYTSGWEVVEYAQPIAELHNLELPIANATNVKRVITIAHTFVVPGSIWDLKLVKKLCQVLL